MTKERASIFAGDNDALDLSGFAPKAGPEPSEVSADLVRAIAEASRFPSREAKPMRRPPRIHRTGRTMQFNARTTPQTVEGLYAIAFAVQTERGSPRFITLPELFLIEKFSEKIE